MYEPAQIEENPAALAATARILAGNHPPLADFLMQVAGALERCPGDLGVIDVPAAALLLGQTESWIYEQVRHKNRTKIPVKQTGTRCSVSFIEAELITWFRGLGK